MLGKAIVRSFVAAAIVSYAVVAQATVNIEFVPVGNPGNANDVPTRNGTSHGGVAYPYLIGKYEVTAGQYTEFLNAKAQLDIYDLYNPLMSSDDPPSGRERTEYPSGIDRSGSEGSYSYSVASDWADRPVNYVSFWDAARFTNWLHNGQGNGDTESGAYLNVGSPDYFARQSGATYFIPTVNEWYKAAYHKNDGVTSNYFLYPTGGDTAPSNDLIDPDPGYNATYADHLDGWSLTIGSPYYRTEVGAHENTASPYGTFDQGGNVFELTEAMAVSNNVRALFGSGYNNANLNMTSYYPASFGDLGAGPIGWDVEVGFRVAGVFEPLLGDANLDGTVDFADLNTVLSYYNQTVTLDWNGWMSGDFDNSGLVDFADLNTVLSYYNQSQSLEAMQMLAAAGITVPEPSSLILLATLLASALGLTFFRRQRGLSFLHPGGRIMKHLLILAVVILSLGALTARAEMITDVSGEIGASKLSFTRSTFDASYDKIEIHLADNLTGTALLQALEGTWTASSGDAIYLSGTSSSWKGKSTNYFNEGQPPPQSYVNFETRNTGATWTRTGSDPDYSTFFGGWYTSDNDFKLRSVDPDLFDDFGQTLLAIMYVSTDAGVGYSGDWGFDSNTVLDGGFTIPAVPEPSTLTLLATGLIGLLCYAWRKKK